MSDVARLFYEETPTEQCMFCETMIDVPEPNQYVVICARCRQKAIETADRLFGDTK